MILRTPAPRKRKTQSQLHEEDEDNNNIHHNITPTPNSGNQLLIFEDLPLAEHTHDHSAPASSDQMLCTYQCRQMVKSEFFDALTTAEKQARDFQSKVEELTNNLSKAEAERKKFRDQFLNVEQELAASNRREQVLQEQLKKEVNFSEEQLRKQIHSFNELEVKFRKEMELRQKAESVAAKAEEKASLLQEKLTTVSESIDREKSRLQSELDYMRSESKSSVSRISANLEIMECRAKNAEEESALLGEQVEELKKRLDELMQEKIQTQKKSPVASPEVPSKDADLLVKHLQEELKNYESEVREARRIKSAHEDIELLKEKLQEEKNRRAKAEVDLSKLCDLQLSVEKLENELSTWKKLIMDIPGVSSADDIIEKFAGLQKEVVDSIMREGEAQARMSQIQVALDAAMLSKQNAETDVAMVKEKAESYKAEITRLESTLASTKEEMNRLKSVIKELKEHKSSEGGAQLTSKTIVQDLEASLVQKENYARELESRLHEQTGINKRQQNEIMLLNDRLSNEAKRVKMLERESDRFRADISLLESKLGHGEFSSANTKVLRMVNTLAVDNEAKQTIEALQNELQKTKEKLQAVEELKKQSPDAGTLVDSEVAGKIKKLKEQIATLEKREERYKMVFAERISVFRRACCELFGYKIVMDDHQRSDGIPVTRFTLQSIYASSDDEKLQFDYESGNTNIVVNGYTSQPEISRQVEIFIRKMNSVPAFTANLTVESFNKRTLS